MYITVKSLNKISNELIVENALFTLECEIEAGDEQILLRAIYDITVHFQ